MISSTFLAPFGFFGGDIGNALLQLEQLGFFSFILPFLIIFSLVFGILSSIKIFEDNKAINGILAFSVGLMALQFGFVSNFFSEIFPRVGIGLVVILIVLIFLGMFMDPDSGGTKWTMFGIGVIVLISILITTAESTSFVSGFWWRNNIGTLLILAFIIAIIGIVVAAGSKNERSSGQSPLERALRGNR